MDGKDRSEWKTPSSRGNELGGGKEENEMGPGISSSRGDDDKGEETKRRVRRGDVGLGGEMSIKNFGEPGISVGYTER